MSILQTELATQENIVTFVPADGDRPPGMPATSDSGRFPLEIFPTAVADYIQQIAQATHTAMDYAAFGLLTIVASLIGATYDIQIVPKWTEPAILYTVLVGAPGIGKSPVLKHLMQPLYDREADYDRDYRADREEWETKKTAWEALKPTERKYEPKPSAPTRQQSYLSDFTIETIRKTLPANPRGVLVFRDELQGWMKSMGQYKAGGSADRQSYLELWTGTALKVNRVGGGREGENQDVTFIRHPRLSILGGIQPKVLQKVVQGPDANDDGFWDRFLIIHPDLPENPVQDAGAEPANSAAWASIVGRLMTLTAAVDPETNTHEPHTVKLGALAEYWQLLTDQFGIEHTRHLSEDKQSRYAKMPALLARLTLILHLVEWAVDGSGKAPDASVSALTLDNAYHVLQRIAELDGKWAQGTGYGKGDAPALGIKRWMTAHRLTTVSVRQVQRSELPGLRAASDIQDAFQRMVDLGWGAIVHKTRQRIEFQALPPAQAKPVALPSLEEIQRDLPF